MSKSAQRKMKDGSIRAIWNSALLRMDYYKRSARGRFISCNPVSGSFIQKGPGYVSKQLDRWQNRVA